MTDANIERYDSGRLVDKWVLITSGNRDGQARRISSVTTTKATVSPSFTGALVNGDTFEILAEMPDLLEDAINRAIRDSWPTKVNERGDPRGLFQRVTNEDLIVDNLLVNPSFETAVSGGSIDGWTNIGTPTLASNTTRRVHGARSLSITASGATEGVEQNIFDLLDIDEMAAKGKTLHVRGWVWDDVASSSRLRVTQDGSTFTNGAYHGGDAEWEGHRTMYVEHPITAGATEMTISCETIDGEVGYFDLVVAWVDPLVEYTMPTDFYPNGPAKVYVQYDQDRPEGLYVPVGGCYPYPGHVLRLEGIGRLSVPTTEAGTTEVDDSEAELIVSLAASNLYRSLGETGKAEYWKATADEDRARYGHLLPSANKREGWRLSSESSRIFYLDR